MKQHIYRSFLLLCFCSAASAESGEAFPTHCKQGEFAYLNAKMAKDETDSNGRFKNEQNGKVLSICMSEAKEPFSKVFYRYGAIGKVEMENVATSAAKWGVYEKSTSPRTGRNIFSFNVGKFKYYVGEETVQASGISLMVFASGKRIVNLFSSDYETGLLNVAFGQPSSPTFVEREPTDEGI
jgi:hypothetical protein